VVWRHPTARPVEYQAFPAATLGDLEAMAHLGNYYASKILGAVERARFDRTKDEKDRAAAVRHLEAAVGHWRKYAETATPLASSAATIFAAPWTAGAPGFASVTTDTPGPPSAADTRGPFA